jgi:hypothetical protein
MAAVAAAESAGAQIEFGPFGSLGRAPADRVEAVVADLTRAALAAGATRVTIQITTDDAHRLLDDPLISSEAFPEGHLSDPSEPDLEHPVVQATQPFSGDQTTRSAPLRRTWCVHVASCGRRRGRRNECQPDHRLQLPQRNPPLRTTAVGQSRRNWTSTTR